MIKMNEKKKDSNWKISFSPIYRYIIVFCLLTLLISLLGGAVYSFLQMKSKASVLLTSVHAQTSQRINETTSLLESLASLPEFYDPDIPPIEKVKKLDHISPYFNYLMICFVDADITVYSDGSEPVSLASRDYMQRLFSTGQRQVTDSFAAGADGVTLNYTVAVPLLDKQGNITGCLFSAIYFDEVVEILKQSAGINGSQATLIGTQGQIMSSTAGLPYGDPILNKLQNAVLFGTTADKLQEQLLAAIPGDYWSFQNGSLDYTAYQRVESTGWDLLCTVSFWPGFSEILPSLLLAAFLIALLCAGLLLLLRKYIAGQMRIVSLLVQSIEKLEKKIYQDDSPGNMDFNELIRLTEKGLSDTLTGLVTRSVFFNQAETQLKKADPKLVSALCFVDMDNLKYINDTYGHFGGDTALKNIGFILREYEKKYEGVAGRYGGDEFVLLLTNLDDEAELNSIMEGLVQRLHSDLDVEGEKISVQSSIGVALCQPDADLEQVIANADDALYFVKQNGKGNYKVFQN